MTRLQKCHGCPYLDWTRLNKGRKVHICNSPFLIEKQESPYLRTIYDNVTTCPYNEPDHPYRNH